MSSALVVVKWCAVIGLCIWFLLLRSRASNSQRTGHAPGSRHSVNTGQKDNGRVISKKKGKTRQKLAIEGAADASPQAFSSSGALPPQEASADKEFARALTTAQTGTSLKRKDGGLKSKKKTLSQKKAGQLGEGSGINGPAPKSPTVAQISHPSPHAWPNAAGAEHDHQIEPPDVIRIIQEEHFPPVPKEGRWTSIPTKSQKTQQRVQRQEATKKQRQRHAEREHQRLLVAEAEQERQRLMQAQRRTARIARGEPAKDGYTEAVTPNENAWNKAEANNLKAAPPKSDPAMLDTLDSSTTLVGPVIMIPEGEEVAGFE